jgi:hemerythrin-like domain-containing protein
MATKKPAEALQVLIDDHKEVKSRYERFQKLGDKDAEEKEQIIEETCTLLSAHAQLEEEMFYPEVREVIKDSSLIDEAEVEHQVAKDLIARLQTEDLEDEERDAVFTVLCEYVQHHVEEEEKELFPQVRKAKDLDLQELGEDLVERKAELMGELESGEGQGRDDTAERGGTASRPRA